MVVTHTHTGFVHSNHSPPFRNTFNTPAVNGHSSNLNDTSAVSNGDHKTTLDLGENSIISNILSMDFDPWDESLTSPQNLVKLLSNGDKQGPQRVSNSRKAHNCNQSRFSFAREDDGCIDQGLSFTQNLSDFQNGFNLRHDFVCNTDVNSASRSQSSAPPGFMGPNRAPPPGFTSNENLSGNHMFNSSPLLRKMNQAPAAVYNSGSVGELEFMDPAILAVGGRVPLGGLTSPGLDMRSNVSSLENDNMLRLLVQRSFTQKSYRLHELGGESFPQRTDAYGVPSRSLDHNNRSAYQQVGSFQQSRMPNNGHWGDSLNEVQNVNDIAMAELLRNERLGGFNKYYSGYEDAKFRVLSSGDVYNRAFGI